MSRTRATSPRLPSVTRPLRRVVRRVRRRAQVREALAVIRGARGVRLVLVYHRVSEREAPGQAIVPTVPAGLFREQLGVFGELANLVPLDAFFQDPVVPDRPLELALTFDDDLGTHVDHVLPLLRELGLHATFFLSGRALHGLGGYWFERLEALIAERGPDETTRLLDLARVPEAELLVRCEADRRRLALIERHAPAVRTTLGKDGIRDLGRSGMTVGFHTLHHPVLPALGETEARDALADGRDALAALVGRPLRWFAYPHGKADGRTVALTREAGFMAAVTTQPHVLQPDGDPYRVGRWEPRPVATDVLLIRLGDVLRRAG